MSQKNIFDFQKKKEIYEFIFQNPGVHLRELSRKLNIPRTTLAYHLKYLNKHDLILSKFVSGYKRYWAANKIGQKDKITVNIEGLKVGIDIWELKETLKL